MDHAREDRPDADALVALFQATFTASEGAEEGRLIGGLVRDLLATTSAEDLCVYTARDDQRALTGALVLTRLRYSDDTRSVFLMSPVAVATAHQRRGVGQALLAFGLSDLRDQGVDVVISYGDPAYYGRVGFERITEAQAASPVPLSQPEGWIARPLTGPDFAPLKGRARCAPALSDPAFW